MYNFNGISMLYTLSIISIIEFAVILFLSVWIYKIKFRNENKNFNMNLIKKSKSEIIDMDNLMNSMHNANKIYKELSIKCHPDRFTESDKKIIAEELFKQVSANKRNFNGLVELKKKAEIDLGIVFK